MNSANIKCNKIYVSSFIDNAPVSYLYENK